MAQSSLWKTGTAIASEVDITSDDARDIGNVDVKTLPNQQVDITDDSSRSLGNTQVTNTVDTTPHENGTGVGTFSTTVNGTSALPSLSVPDSAELLLLAADDNGGEVLIDGTFPLKAGDAFALPVSNADNISVETASSQTIYGITISGVV